MEPMMILIMSVEVVIIPGGSKILTTDDRQGWCLAARPTGEGGRDGGAWGVGPRGVRRVSNGDRSVGSY